jgi:hypothetical protein
VIRVKLYHGTARALGAAIEIEGLNPKGAFADLPKEFRPTNRGKSSYSEEGYVYFFDDINRARHFACGSAFKVGFSMHGEIFEIDSDEVSVEKDPLFPAGSFRVKGAVPREKLKVVEKEVDCEKLGWGKRYWAREIKLFKEIGL